MISHWPISFWWLIYLNRFNEVLSKEFGDRDPNHQPSDLIGPYLWVGPIVNEDLQTHLQQLLQEASYNKGQEKEMFCNSS